MNPADMQAAVETVAEDAPRGTVPTGSYGLDRLLGGGWPENLVSEIHGPAMSGKSTLALATAARVSQRGIVLYLDLDGSYNPARGSRMGVDQDNLIVTRRPETVVDFFQYGHPAELVVFDGIPAQEDAREISGILADVPCTALCVTQEREQLVPRGRTWVSAGTTGGWISEPSVRVRLSPDANGFTCAEVKHNVTSSPVLAPAYFRICDSGIDTAEELYALGLAFGVIEKRQGSRFWVLRGDHSEQYLGHGAGAALDTIAADQKLAEYIWDEVVALGGCDW